MSCQCSFSLTFLIGNNVKSFLMSWPNHVECRCQWKKQTKECDKKQSSYIFPCPSTEQDVKSISNGSFTKKIINQNIPFIAALWHCSTQIYLSVSKSWVQKGRTNTTFYNKSRSHTLCTLCGEHAVLCCLDIISLQQTSQLSRDLLNGHEAVQATVLGVWCWTNCWWIWESFKFNLPSGL